MSVELKPCPFCGAKDEKLVQSFIRASYTFSYWSVECLECGAEIGDDESQEAADEHWNTRALSPSHNDGLVEALRNALAADLPDVVASNVREALRKAGAL